jgi:type 1 glutamine amidotransferase
MLAVAAGAAEPVRLLLVQGGHDFETNQFLEIFRSNPEVRFEVAAHPGAHARLGAAAAGQWDVLVLYDMWQEIGEEAKADLVARLKEGKGLVVLHHALADYQGWPEYERIVGGRYHLQKRKVNGTDRPQSTYKHDVDIPVRVANREHPVTRGVSDFTIHDETYGLFDVSPQTQALLTTEEPTSGRTIAWAKTYESARVVYLQLGHDHQAYENPNYRRLLANALRWVAKRD